MVAWGWLIVTFFAGAIAGVFLFAVAKAGYPNIEEEQHLEDKEMIVRESDGQLTKYDRWGVSVYDPETGTWKSLN